MDELNQFQDDRRVFERFPVSLPVDLVDLDFEKELEAVACDVSAKGVGVISKESLMLGNRLELKLAINDGGDPFYTRGSVMWSMEEATGGYRSGIALDKPELMAMARILRS